MRRFILSAAAVVLSLALAATAEAGPKGGSGGGHPGGGQPGGSGKGGSSKGGGSHKGVKSFKGKAGHNWSSKHWDKRYGCNLYFDAGSGRWYYWCPPDGCYYPIDYCPYDTYSWDDDSN